MKKYKPPMFSSHQESGIDLKLFTIKLISKYGYKLEI